MQGLSGVYFFYFTIVMLLLAGGVYALFGLLDRDWAVFKRLALAGVACGLAGALLVPVLWPYQQVHDDLGIERTRPRSASGARRPATTWPRRRATGSGTRRRRAGIATWSATSSPGWG